MGDADKVLLLVEPGAPKDQDRAILKQLQEQKAEVILVINKMDKVPKPELLKTMEAFRDAYAFARHLFRPAPKRAKIRKSF